ncbi:MAG: TrkH family potassium uptake protein [Barnesiella sp.]|nr:TrkH family potassium uptake protein [Barnesiella sp.]
MSIRTASRRRRRMKFNVPELVRIAGFLTLIEGVFMLPPFLYALIRERGEWMAFGISILICVVIGVAIITTVKPRVKDMGKRDGVLLTAFVWVIFSLFGMLPFMLCDVHLNFCEAFFEAMSGFTTTGASVFGDISDLPRGLHLWRCIMQWLGGVGIIIFTVALLPMLNSAGGVQMFNAESTGITHDKLQPRVSQTAKRMWLIYCVLTLALGLILWIGPLPLYESVCQSLSTVSTGGLNSCSADNTAWSSPVVRIPVIIFMFIGGVNFVLIYRASLGQVRKVWADVNFRTYTRAVVLVTLFIIAVLLIDGERDVEKILIEPLFQVVSSITSTGYTVDDLDSWNEVVIPVLLVLLIMGACAGSTSGGIKIDRVIFMVKNARNELRKFVNPNRYYPLTINGTVKPPELVMKVTSFFVFYVLILIAGGVVITAMGMPLSDAYFVTLSCIGNTGLSVGPTAESYAVVPDAGKLVLSVIMLVGRLEIFTIIILVTRNFWRR